MHKCHVILQVIASGFRVDIERFREYCINVAKRILELYPWYMMPTAVHKILIHGHLIIYWSLLPIGELSEEAQESRNKDIKAFRERFARKFSREKNMQDVFQRLLVSSDPLITSIGNIRPKKSTNLSEEAIQLLLPSTIVEKNSATENYYESDSDTDSD